MNRSRLSIASLMAIVCFIALDFAALKNATALWSSVLFMFTVGVLSTAILGAIACSGHARKTWAGVAIFGWVYLGIVFGPLPNGNGATIPPLPTLVVYEYLLNNNFRTQSNVHFINTTQAETILDKAGSTNSPIGKAPLAVQVVDVIHLKRIVHSTGAIVFAFIGGFVGRIVASHDARSNL
jgi:hypothetical protein